VEELKVRRKDEEDVYKEASYSKEWINKWMNRYPVYSE
jgi:hypothetical protein